MVFIHCTKKVEKLLNESGLYSDSLEKPHTVKEIPIQDEMFHWHLNSVYINGSHLMIMTHDISGVAGVLYFKKMSAVKNQLNVLLQTLIERLFSIAGCSDSFINEYMRQSVDLIFTTPRGPKQLSKNTVAFKRIKSQIVNLELDEIFQSHLTESYNSMPKKSLGYQSPNEILLKESKKWINGAKD